MPTATASKPSRKGSSKQGSRKQGNGQRKAAGTTRPEVNPFECFKGYSRGNYSEYCKKKGIRLNQTGIHLPTDDAGEAFARAVNRSNSAFAEASTRWEANEQYGRQHYNRFGFMHRDGLTRLDDEALAFLISQAGEELAQRAVHSGTDVENKRINPAVAANFVQGLSAWLANRPAEIKASRKAQAYALVESETGGKVLETTAG